MSQDKDLAYLNSWLSKIDKKEGVREQTLGEYLSKFSSPKLQNSIVKNNLISEIEELLADLDDSSNEDSGQMVERNDILSNSVNVEIRESKKFIGRTYSSENVFTKIGKDVRPTTDQRKPKFANTSAKLIYEKHIAPLNLPQYVTY